jgi:hypothetical protein
MIRTSDFQIVDQPRRAQLGGRQHDQRLAQCDVGWRIGISNDISRELALFSPYFGRSTARSQAINPPLH